MVTQKIIFLLAVERTMACPAVLDGQELCRGDQDTIKIDGCTFDLAEKGVPSKAGMVEGAVRLSGVKGYF